MWYVIQTLKGRERRDAESLKRDVAKPGEEIFVIESERPFRIRREWIKELKPLFPGYIFVCTEDINGFEHRLRGKHRRQRLLSMDGKVIAISDKEEAYLKQIGGEEHIVRYSEGIRINDTVRIISGPLEGSEGRIVRLDRHNRKARIAVPLMGREVEVEIGLGIVKSITVADTRNHSAG